MTRMKSFWDLVLTLATGLATWLAPLDVEPALKPVAAMGTVIGAGLVTTAYGLLGRDAVATRFGSTRQLILFVAACTACLAAYVAIRRYTFTETEPRFWGLAIVLWLFSLLLAGLFSLVGMLAAEELNK